MKLEPVEFTTAVFEQSAGDGEAVEQGFVAERLAVKGDGGLGGFAPDDRNARLPGEFTQTVKNAGAHAANARFLLRHDAGMNREEIEEDVSAPGAAAVREAEEAIANCSSRREEAHFLALCIALFALD